MVKIYGLTRAVDFGPRALRVVRQEMLTQGLCRRSINARIDQIRRVFKWGVSEELVPSAVLHALQAVGGLRRGHCDARESEPVRPVAQVLIDAVENRVSRQVWAMIRLQQLTAARSGEIVIMRPMDVDRSGKIWVYTPAHHKTAHHGHQRKIYLGPKAQQELAPFLLRPDDTYCFSPAEAEAERYQAQHAARKTPLSCGNRPGTNRQENPIRAPGAAYTVESYARAITRACELAFPPPPELGPRQKESLKAWKRRLTPQEKQQLAAWRREHHWHPHQLRHNAATELRKEFGIETARIILGHRSAVMTEVYAELDHARAIEVMSRVG